MATNFSKDRQGRKGGGVALCVKKDCECMEINDGDDRVESLWVGIKAKASKIDKANYEDYKNVVKLCRETLERPKPS